MDVRTLLNNLHREIFCPECKSTLDEPKTLQCLHSVCLRCLNNILRTSGRRDIIKCPECQRESEVPESGNLQDLPSNFRIVSVLDLKAIKECDTTDVKCGNCDKISAQSWYCFGCWTLWCEDCISAHNVIRENKRHRVLATRDFEDKDFEDILKRPAFCSKLGHERRELEFFCTICGTIVCDACALTHHDGHDKIPLKQAAIERREEFKSKIESKKKRLKTMKDEMGNFEKEWPEIQENAAYVERSVQKFADEIISVIEAKKEAIITEVKESIQCQEARHSENEREIKITEEALELAETLLKRSPNVEIVQPNKFIDNVLQNDPAKEVQDFDEKSDDSDVFGDFLKNQKFFDYVCRKTIGTLKFFPTKTRPHLSDATGRGLTQACEGLKAYIILTTRNREGEQCYQKHDCVTVVGGDSYSEKELETQIQDNEDGTYEISYFPEFKRQGFKPPESLKIQINGEHVHGSPFAVSVDTRKFSPVMSFGQQGSSEGMFNGPCGVAVNERDEIAVSDSDNHRVQVFSSDGTYLRSFGAEGDKQGEFHTPSGIAFEANGNIVVGDSGNQRIQFFSGEGEFKSQIVNSTSLDHCLPESCGISVDNDGNIIVPDCREKSVKIFSPGGQLLRTIGEGQLTSPSHCIQYRDHFFVSDKGDHRIKAFDMEGRLLNSYGSEGVGNKQFNNPCYLSVDKAGRLMICDKLNHRIQLLDISSGKFQTKFDIKGEGIGGLGTPVSMAVLSNGRIVVSDSLHHCVHIYE